MFKRFAFLILAIGTSAQAETPAVAADILPVHGLVSAVMGDLGTPDLIIPPGQNTHRATLRPSQAKTVKDANVIFWIGPDNTPWLEDALTQIGAASTKVPLLEHPDTRTYSFRENAVFEDHDDHEHEHEHDHGDQSHDPHAWMDPENAQRWLSIIAEALSQADPENADQYRANADTTARKIATLQAEIQAQIAPLQDVPYLVDHDAYQYFEESFGISPLGAVTLADAESPSAAHMVELQSLVKTENIRCIFVEPNGNANLSNRLLEGTNAKIAELDPMGRNLQPGPNFYPVFLEKIAKDLVGCLQG